MKPDEIALSYFNNGFNCAESVLMAVGEELRLDGLQPQRLATGFGAGVARQGYICGCLSGATMAVGRVEGSDQGSKELVYEIVGRIFAEFSKRLLVIDCRQLTGLDFTASHASPDELQKVQRDVCGPLVSFVTLLTIAEL